MTFKKKSYLFFCLAFSLIGNNLFSSTYFQKAPLIRNIRNCFTIQDYEVCKQMVVELERIQLIEYEKGNIKCQTSLLGVQTELVRNIYFDIPREHKPGKTISSVIKNC